MTRRRQAALRRDRGLLEPALGVRGLARCRAEAGPRWLRPSALSPADRSTRCAEIVGAEHVLVDDGPGGCAPAASRRPTCCAPDPGESDAPDAVVRPGLARRGRRRPRWAVEHHIAGRAVRRRHLRDRRPRRVRDGFAGLVSLDLGRMKRLLSVDHDLRDRRPRAGPARPRGRGLLGRARLLARPLPAVLRVRHDRRLRGHPVLRPVQRGLRPLRRPGRRPAAVATPRGDLRLGSAPANAAGPDLRQLFLGSEGAFGVITEVTVRVRQLPEVKVYEGWRWPSFAAGADAMRDARPGRDAADRAPALRRGRDRRSTWPAPTRSAAVTSRLTGGCLMITGFEGTPRRVEAGAPRSPRCSPASAARRSARRRRGLGARPLQRAVPPRLDARRRRAGRDARDRDVLVQRVGADAAVTRGADHALAERHPWCCATSRTSTRPAARSTSRSSPGDAATRSPQWLAAKAAASDAIIAAGATITHHHAVGTDHRPWLRDEIGELGVSVLRAVKADARPDRYPQPGRADSVTDDRRVTG